MNARYTFSSCLHGRFRLVGRSPLSVGRLLDHSLHLGLTMPSLHLHVLVFLPTTTRLESEGAGFRRHAVRVGVLDLKYFACFSVSA